MPTIPPRKGLRSPYATLYACVMTQTAATKPAATRTCPRCAGTGEKFHGMCFRCHGVGTVELTDRTPRIDPAIGERRYHLILVLRERALELDGHANGSIALESAWGRDLLETREPERHARALTSIEQGHTDAVIHALVAYYHECVDRFPIGTLVAWTFIADDEDGDQRSYTMNGTIDAYHGMLDDEPTWIINRNGAMHYVPESKIRRF